MEALSLPRLAAHSAAHLVGALLCKLRLLLHRRLRMDVMGLGAIIDIGAKTVTSGINGFTFSGGTYQSEIAAQFNLANVIFHNHMNIE